MNHKLEIFTQCLSLFTNKPIPLKIVSDYIADDKKAYLQLADFIGINLKKEFSWSTTIGIIEAVEHMYEEAKANGNLKNKR